ncbi:hypothetical protein HX057_16340 [Myroides odoratimimus]|uniref:hypothetical protein n=2 Tax=Myroides odoratimimus TaxID=76832 RepID=UPI002576EB9A|nr:hypothetical protein [Myroides odoratimimus]MDM1415815.1 hypothetical protein [Myroides odoratimimus]MDM1444309.1 hypothetical protein [Myroides odoratimimus]MDM1448302.1 hypothetical protein [Myroides odoratimimus]MDM1511076.1 hypothetical protein [Myroides odoratimimus]MEC4009373.1 hypothetical protein [Myroides odoratimimus]
MIISFDLNDFPKWEDFNWTEFEISNSLFVLKRLITLQNESFNQVREELDKKIKKTETENTDLDEEVMYQYIDHLYGMEKTIINELEIIQKGSQITTALSIFESKLKMFSDKIKSSFNFNIPNNHSRSYTRNHWNYIKAFIGKENLLIETQFNEITNSSIIRNIIVHQNLVAKQGQYNRIKHLNGLKFYKFNNSYYLSSIELDFIYQLVLKIELFFEGLLDLIKNKTNRLLEK